MTALNLLDPNASFGDILTTTNNGAGLSTILKELQDGFGNSSTITIATNAINFDRSGGNTFQLDSVSLTASAANINSICGNTPIFTGNYPVQMPHGTTAQRPVIPQNGMYWYNDSLNAVEMYSNGAWVQVT